MKPYRILNKYSDPIIYNKITGEWIEYSTKTSKLKIHSYNKIKR